MTGAAPKLAGGQHLECEVELVSAAQGRHAAVQHLHPQNASRSEISGGVEAAPPGHNRGLAAARGGSGGKASGSQAYGGSSGSATNTLPRRTNERGDRRRARCRGTPSQAHPSCERETRESWHKRIPSTATSETVHAGHPCGIWRRQASVRRQESRTRTLSTSTPANLHTGECSQCAKRPRQPVPTGSGTMQQIVGVECAQDFGATRKSRLLSLAGGASDHEPAVHRVWADALLNRLAVL